MTVRASVSNFPFCIPARSIPRDFGNKTYKPITYNFMYFGAAGENFPFALDNYKFSLKNRLSKCKTKQPKMRLRRPIGTVVLL